MEEPTADLDYVRRIVERTHARVDPHAFHFVLWGAIVFVSYPLLNWLELGGRRGPMPWVGGGALLLGTLVSTIFETVNRKPRIKGENTFVARQVMMIVFSNLLVAFFLSAAGPATGFIPGPYVNVLWGFVYANMAFMIGVVYTREYLLAGAFIAAGTVLALFLPGRAGFVLGPFMGLGMIVPGVMGERRVARLRRESGGL
jgi:hypothetical protein